MSEQDPSRLLIIDGHALIYRAYHAFPPLHTQSGQLVNAVYGFTRILLTVLQNFEPEYLTVMFDHPKKTFRHEAFEEYKAHREEMPDDLKPQIQIIKDVVAAMNIPIFEMPGYEADDLIGTVSCQLDELNGERVQAVIVTGDKDLLQLVNDRVHVYIPKRGKFGEDIEYDAQKVQQKLGITPAQLTDLKALMGDSSDNIPGVKGVGKKTATKLVQEFGTLETLYQEVERVAQADTVHPILKGALLKKLVTDRDQAFTSKQLATIDCAAPVELKLEDCRVQGYNKQEVVELFENLDFSSLIPLLPDDEFESGIQTALF